MKERIGELDTLRGIAILGMIYVHFLYDLKAFQKIPLSLSLGVSLAGQWGHLLFLLISGICATLGSRGFRRGVQVFCAGLLVSYCTLFGELILGMKNIRIWFGILHLLGLSMMVYPLFRKLNNPLLALTGVVIIVLGILFEGQRVFISGLCPLGLCREGFYPGSDFFPVFPNLGWFLLGAVAGRTLYRDQKSRFPDIHFEMPIFRFLCLCGRYSLPIYLLHQPVLLLILEIL